MVQTRDACAQEAGVYVPLCCDGGFHRDALLVPVSAESFKQTGAEVRLRPPTIDAGE
ncbi:hypothetical protein ACFYYS_07745 [Streptomyces sp. NPDC002120]|uniref:hypothetical protein n=1 Tax=Streptomyces sp. NPDC002120 TaxID=3364631 RepID=UPI0036AEE6DA